MGHLSVDTPQRAPSRRGNIYDRITLTLLIFSTLFGVLGIATGNWRARGKNIFDLGNDSYLVATKALAVIGVVGAVLGLVLEITIIVAPSMRKRIVLIIGLFIQIIAVGGMVIACGVFGHQECGGRDGVMTAIQGNFNNQCGYSYWFLVIAAIFNTEGIVFHFFAIRSKY